MYSIAYVNPGWNLIHLFEFVLDSPRIWFLNCLLLYSSGVLNHRKRRQKSQHSLSLSHWPLISITGSQLPWSFVSQWDNQINLNVLYTSLNLHTCRGLVLPPMYSYMCICSLYYLYNTNKVKLYLSKIYHSEKWFKAAYAKIDILFF